MAGHRNDKRERHKYKHKHHHKRRHDAPKRRHRLKPLPRVSVEDNSGNGRRLAFLAAVALLVCIAVVVVFVICNRGGGNAKPANGAGTTGGSGGSDTPVTPKEEEKPHMSVEAACQILTGIVKKGGKSGIPKAVAAVESLLERVADGETLTETLKTKLREVVTTVRTHDTDNYSKIKDRGLSKCGRSKGWKFLKSKNVEDLLTELTGEDKWNDSKWCSGTLWD